MDSLHNNLPLQSNRFQTIQKTCKQGKCISTRFYELTHTVLMLLLCIAHIYPAVSRVVWPGSLSSDAYSSFQRGGELGVCLCEPWLVANAATYLCNYSQHLLETGALSRLAPVFRPLLASLTSAGRLQLQNGSQHTMLVGTHIHFIWFL